MMSNELSRMYAKHNPGVVVPSIDELAEWAASHIAGLENQVALLRTPLGEIAIERVTLKCTEAGAWVRAD